MEVKGKPRALAWGIVTLPLWKVGGLLIDELL